MNMDRNDPMSQGYGSDNGEQQYANQNPDGQTTYRRHRRSERYHTEENASAAQDVQPRTPDDASQVRASRSAVRRGAPSVQYTGTLSCAAMDADSPVYLALDGVVYEACPTDGGFCLYAPGAQEIAVYVMADGELARCEV